MITTSSSEYSDIQWITWFTELPGNEFFCEIDEEFIRSDFNLYNLERKVRNYSEARKIILDLDIFPQSSDSNDDLKNNAFNLNMIEVEAQKLYGLIHARFIMTDDGILKMKRKFHNAEFGRCHRVKCKEQARFLKIGIGNFALAPLFISEGGSTELN